MSYALAIIVIVFIGDNAVNSADCETVAQGAHYSTVLPFSGFKSDATISSRVQFANSSARYLFSPTDTQGHLCGISWNKLWGACRCGYFANNHQDSDRFVFRRAQSCLIYENDLVIGENVTCSELDLVEIAAYAYDNGDKPFENQGRLLKEFSTKLRVNDWYKVTLIFEETKTIYQLFDNNDQLLETQEIIHRICKDFTKGMMQGLYFGGQCPAPQAVSACYVKV